MDDAQRASARRSLVARARSSARRSRSGALNGGLIVVTRVPDIVVTLAMLFVWGGAALAVMQIPGGGAPLEWLKN